MEGPLTVLDSLVWNRDIHMLDCSCCGVMCFVKASLVPCEQEHCPGQIFEPVFNMPGEPTDTVTQLLGVHNSLHAGEGWGVVLNICLRGNALPCAES